MSSDPLSFFTVDRGTASTAVSLIAPVEGRFRLLASGTGPAGADPDALLEDLAQRVAAVDAELRLLLNWFAHDSVVLQTGVALGFDWASQPWAGQSLWSARDARVGFQAGLYVGWVNEAPAI